MFVYRDDNQMKEELLKGNEGAIRYVFYEHYNALLKTNVAKTSWQKEVEYDDLVQELYIYLSADNWQKVRSYNPSQPFANWFSVVSYRFFKDFCRSLIDSSEKMPISDMNDNDLNISQRSEAENSLIFDLQLLLPGFEPPRDREVLKAYLLEGAEPDEIASRLGVTVDNYYNIKSRAIARLVKNYLQGYNK
jgi:RNA polymerase sigma factor (sigma-70 family)